MRSIWKNVVAGAERGNDCAGGTMIRFLLIGAGRIGRIHAENIVRGGASALAAVTDADPRAATELAKQWSCRTVKPDEALTQPDIDAVLIASSTDTHADWIERCAA